MRFIQNHYLIVLISISLSLVIFFRRHRLYRWNERVRRFIENRNFVLAAIIGLITFYVLFYLLKPVYYTPYIINLIGDNYNYTTKGVSNSNWYTPQHIFFPFVPAKIFEAIRSLGFYPDDGRMFLEKAFAFFSLPNRIFVLAGFLFLYLTLRLFEMNPPIAIVGVWFYATTFGSWFFALQNNSTGFLQPMVILAIYTTVRSLKEKKNYLFVLSALFTSFCVFIHISAIYMAIAIFLYVWYCCLQNATKDKTASALINIVSFTATAMIGGLVFYYLSAIYHGTFGAIELVHHIGDRAMMGDFRLNFDFFKIFFRDSISATVSMIIGLAQIPFTGLIKSAIITLQLTCLLLIGLSLKELKLKRMVNDPSIHNPLLLVCFLFLGILVGFSLRKTWQQYWGLVTPVFAILFLFFAFCSYRKTKTSYNLIVICVLIICNLAINGFSSTKAYEGHKIRDHIIYQTLDAIAEHFPNKSVLYFGSPEPSIGSNQRILQYYRITGRFSEIFWEDPVDIVDVLRRKKGGYEIILLKRSDYPDIQDNLHFDTVLRKIDVGSFQFYLVVQ